MMDDKNELADQNLGNSNSINSAVQETRITIRDDGNFQDRRDQCGGGSDEKSKGVMGNAELRQGSSGVGVGEPSCPDNAGRGNKEILDNQKLCRICHLSRLEEKEMDLSDLIELGCACRGELGFAHSLCAEAWFKLRGNRLCEICGETAENISGTSDNRFIEEWNENGLAAGATPVSRRRVCWQDQPLCNFLMACLVLAFVLSWFFRVNMF
ncbi:OLC1v1021262C1 [Oldenlandia corymbosa var. corymbosa]|uniref:OLC1v1021262C1 n=1 Tax=Oldenlandia corymbosa var. corymbosa TaxID=529605 RepID=A0AAV1BXQ7_OLDCO|nr:OLC1v1021262C1 [Oldenlandia corymbosa var. corymbosa]